MAVANFLPYTNVKQRQEKSLRQLYRKVDELPEYEKQQYFLFVEYLLNNVEQYQAPFTLALYYYLLVITESDEKNIDEVVDHCISVFDDYDKTSFDSFLAEFDEYSEKIGRSFLWAAASIVWETEYSITHQRIAEGEDALARFEKASFVWKDGGWKSRVSLVAKKKGQ